MSDHTKTQTDSKSRSRPRRRKKRQADLTQEAKDEIVRLHAHYGTRQISPRVGWSRKIVRQVLLDHGCLSPERSNQHTSKIDAFRELIETKIEKDLTVTRILREIREEGYSGGRTILAVYVRTRRAELALIPAKKAKRRFETRPGKETQIDWSPYDVSIADAMVSVHAFGALLGSSRKLWAHCYRNERQPILLEALATAFDYFDGCTLSVVLDNMSTAVLGRYAADGKPIWHPTFLDFARHYGFEPFACAVRDPDRKGKKEKSFRLLWDDFLKGSEFESLDELNQRLAYWLDQTPEVANLRIHGTTGLVPNEAWRSEREFLIPLPDKRFPACENSVRSVDADSTLSIHGKLYTVPSSLANRAVAVRLYAEHFEVLDSYGHVGFSRRYVPETDPRKLIIDDTHYAAHKRRPRGDGKRLCDAFAKRFPALAPLLSGLQLRMKALAPVHVRALLRLAERYGEQAFLGAATRAQEYRRFDAHAVERILERQGLPPDNEPAAPLGGIGAVLLGEVDSGSLDIYSHLDSEPTSTNTDPDTEDEHGS